MTTQKYFNSIIAKVTYQLNKIANILSIAPFNTKKILCSSLIVNIIRYGVGLLTTINKIQIKKISSLMLKVSRKILGIKSYKMSTKKNFSEL